MNVTTTRQLLVEALGITFAGALAAYGLNAVRPDRVAFEAPPRVESCGAEASAEAVVHRVTATEALAELELGALALDTREADAYAHGHVEGALHVPCSASSSDVDAVVDALRGRPTVVVYGEAQDDVLALASELLTRLGPGVRVVAVDGGFEALGHAGAPAASGRCPDCSEPSP